MIRWENVMKREMRKVRAKGIILFNWKFIEKEKKTFKEMK